MPLARVLAVLVVLLAVRDAVALVQLQLDLGTRLEDALQLDLSVTNIGDDFAGDVVPRASFQGLQHDGAPLRALPARATHDWQFRLPLPSGPGEFPLLARVRYTDPSGRPLTAQLLHRVRTAGASDGPARITYPPVVVPIGRFSLVRPHVENRGAAPLAGRLGAAVPNEFRAEQQTWSLDLPAGGGVDVPVFFENTGGPPGMAYSVYVVFEYDLGGVHYAPVAVMRFVVSGSDGADLGRPMLVAGFALAGLVVLVLGAVRYARGRPPWKRGANPRSREPAHAS